MDKEFESTVDYFLRYHAFIPIGETDLHKEFDRDCECKPHITFDEINGWRYFGHYKVKSS